VSLRFAVLGDPIEHSRSPAMHTAAFRALGLIHRYERIRVAKGALEPALCRLSEQGYRGVNLTVPHKREGAALMDHLVGPAARLGTVNTVDLSGGAGRWTGHATDGPGFVAALGELSVPRLRHAVVLGTGGAAHCIVDALLHTFPELELAWVSRDPAATTAPDPRVELHGWDAVPWKGQLLVNATTVGMRGGPKEFPRPIEFSRFDAGAGVVDIVYPRPVGGLLDQAAEAGLVVQDGLPMLLWQGVKALEIWLQSPIGDDVVAAMRSALEA
jgi:shikimate dehydrogenase